MSRILSSRPSSVLAARSSGWPSSGGPFSLSMGSKIGGFSADLDPMPRIFVGAVVG